MSGERRLFFRLMRGRLSGSNEAGQRESAHFRIRAPTPFANVTGFLFWRWAAAVAGWQRRRWVVRIICMRWHPCALIWTPIF